MALSVSIIDYDVGNLLSVTRAFAAVGADPVLASSPDEIQSAERLVLPGVGAFKDGMKELERRGFSNAILRYCESQRPFLGICLGMQMMLTSSEEFGSHQGLDLISGRVVKVPDVGSKGTRHKIPHIGWNTLCPGGSAGGWDQTILMGLPQDPAVYFVHSYAAEPYDPSHSLATCDYDGVRITAVVYQDNVIGTQFHPEKSGPIGLRMLKNFMAM